VTTRRFVIPLAILVALAAAAALAMALRRDECDALRVAFPKGAPPGTAAVEVTHCLDNGVLCRQVLYLDGRRTSEHLGKCVPLVPGQEL
jgi:hypothetical protein